MARFRLFGRPGGPATAEAEPPPPRSPAPWGVAPVGAGVPWPRPTGAETVGGDGPATRAARPAAARPAARNRAVPPPRPAGAAVAPARPRATAPGRLPPASGAPGAAATRSPYADPPTDPFGFPPIPPLEPPPVDRAEASALAAAFALDYLSWDEDEPDRRGRVLLDYLPAPGCDPARLGWSGRGRQRAELALPGRVRPDGDGRVLVDVRVRVTPYRPVGEHGPAAEPADPAVPGVPAAAPAPTGRGWRSLASSWVRLSVPVTHDGPRLVVDAWEETLGEEPPPAVPAVPAGEDPTLADDDPLAEPVAGAVP